MTFWIKLKQKKKTVLKNTSNVELDIKERH